nr:extracellular solute-binding protein [bacterium]
MSKKHVKLMGLILAVLMIVALFAGCGKPSTTKAPDGTPTVEGTPETTGTPGQELYWPVGIEPSSLNGKKITIYTDGEIPSDPASRDYRMREDFTKKYGVTFEHVATGGEEDGWMTKLALLVATNAGPTIVENDNSSMPLAAARGLVQPIDQWVNEKDTIFLKEPMDAYSWNGHRYVMQFRSWITFRSIIYSLTAFEKAGLEAPLETWEKGDWSWEKLFEVSKEFFETDAAGAQTSYGWTFTNVDVGFALGLNSADFFKVENGSYKLNASDPKVQEIMTMFYDANQRGDIMYRSSKQAEVAKGTVKLYGQIWERAERLLKLPEAQESGNLMQSVPMPTGPSAAEDKMYGLVPWFFMIGANSPNPDAGYFWQWYNGDQFEPEPREGDDPPMTEEEYIKTKPEHVQGMYAIFNDIKENGTFIIATNVEGVPGFADLFTSLCNKVYRDKGSLSTVLTELSPQMQEALNSIGDYETLDPTQIGTPKLPEAGVANFVKASDGAEVAIDGDKMTITMAVAEDDWLDIEAAKIEGDFFFPALNYYQVNFDFKVTSGFDALAGGCISYGLKSKDGKVLNATTLWGDYEEEGSMDNEGKLMIIDQKDEDGAYFFIDFSGDFKADTPVVIEITNFSITKAE